MCVYHSGIRVDLQLLHSSHKFSQSVVSRLSIETEIRASRSFNFVVAVNTIVVVCPHHDLYRWLVVSRLI